MHFPREKANRESGDNGAAWWNLTSGQVGLQGDRAPESPPGRSGST